MDKVYFMLGMAALLVLAFAVCGFIGFVAYRTSTLIDKSGNHDEDQD